MLLYYSAFSAKICGISSRLLDFYNDSLVEKLSYYATFLPSNPKRALFGESEFITG
jgi:hypothetical protein